MLKYSREQGGRVGKVLEELQWTMNTDGHKTVKGLGDAILCNCLIVLIMSSKRQIGREQESFNCKITATQQLRMFSKYVNDILV